jgi:hypothetical protein
VARPDGHRDARHGGPGGRSSRAADERAEEAGREPGGEQQATDERDDRIAGWDEQPATAGTHRVDRPGELADDHRRRKDDGDAGENGSDIRRPAWQARPQLLVRRPDGRPTGDRHDGADRGDPPDRYDHQVMHDQEDSQAGEAGESARLDAYTRFAHGAQVRIRPPVPSRRRPSAAA